MTSDQVVRRGETNGFDHTCKRRHQHDSAPTITALGTSSETPRRSLYGNIARYFALGIRLRSYFYATHCFTHRLMASSVTQRTEATWTCYHLSPWSWACASPVLANAEALSASASCCTVLALSASSSLARFSSAYVRGNSNTIARLVRVWTINFPKCRTPR